MPHANVLSHEARGQHRLGASYHLPRLVGTSVAAELLYTGRFIDAERALRVGLVSEVVPMDQLEAAGQALADDMLATAPLGLRLTKECFWAAVDGNDLSSAIARWRTAARC